MPANCPLSKVESFKVCHGPVIVQILPLRVWGVNCTDRDACFNDNTCLYTPALPVAPSTREYWLLVMNTLSYYTSYSRKIFLTNCHFKTPPKICSSCGTNTVFRFDNLNLRNNISLISQFFFNLVVQLILTSQVQSTNWTWITRNKIFRPNLIYKVTLLTMHFFLVF